MGDYIIYHFLNFARFREPGVYYYSGNGIVQMKGVIRVLPHGAQTGPITIKIDGKVHALQIFPPPDINLLAHFLLC